MSRYNTCLPQTLGTLKLFECNSAVLNLIYTALLHPQIVFLSNFLNAKLQLLHWLLFIYLEYVILYVTFIIIISFVFLFIFLEVSVFIASIKMGKFFLQKNLKKHKCSIAFNHDVQVFSKESKRIKHDTYWYRRCLSGVL